MEDLGQIKGWCLVRDEEAILTYPRGIMGALFSCPYCGIIKEKANESGHVLNPSEPLLERLRNTKLQDRSFEWYPACRVLMVQSGNGFVIHFESEPLSGVPACGAEGDLIGGHMGMSPDVIDRLCPICRELETKKD